MRAVISKREAMEILGLSSNVFYSTINQRESKVVPSIIKGKYSYKSILKEFERIHGFSYWDAVVDESKF